MYKVILSRQANKELDKFPRKYALAIFDKLESLQKDSRPNEVKRLTDGSYRIRQGDYRIIYDILDKELHVHVLRIGHLKEVYR